MRISEAMQMYGDIELPPSVMKELGIDFSPMLTAKQVRKLTGRDGYDIIRRIRSKHHLEYPEAVIALKYVREEYGI